jgi:hypothetical protein
MKINVNNLRKFDSFVANMKCYSLNVIIRIEGAINDHDQ